MDGEAHTHAPQLDLLPTDAAGRAPMATHVAVRDGDWFDPATWASGQVPGQGALVHVPAGVSVHYDGASDAELFIVRVDGELSFGAANGSATRMVVDTIVTAPGSTFRVDASAPSDGTVDIVFDEGRPAAHGGHYTDRSTGDGVIGRHEWDPEQLSLGLVAGGAVEVHGREIEGSLQFQRGPVAGATKMTLDAPDGDPGWAVGQKIVIGGMGYRGLDGRERLVAEDEVREIVDVRYASGRIVVEVDRPLEHDHRGPVDPATGEEIAGHVGNLGRNVTFSSAVADLDGDGLADRGLSLGGQKGAAEHYVTERGHVMFMHNDDVGVTNASFFGLGRTDKSVGVDDYVTGGNGNHRLHEDNGTPGAYDPGVDLAIETPADEMTNQRGRYALHIHEAGTGGGHGDHQTGGKPGHCADQDGDGIDDCDDPDYFDGAYIEGNVIWGSPGWGLVQHDSRAMLKGNLAFDVAGSAFVAEIGNETGRWEKNLAIGTYGAGERPNGDDASDFNEDSGYEGNGFYLKSRAIEVEGNVAHSSARAGFYYHNHGIAHADTPTGALGDLAIADGAESVATEDVPIRAFEDNAVFAARQGIRIVTDPLDAVRKFNDAWSHMKDFRAVAVDESGVSVTYSSKYVFENFTIFGTERKVSPDAQNASAGFFFKASAADLTVLGGHVENFGNAVTNWSMIGDRQEYRRGYWDPKNPTSDSPDTPRYDGMGAVEGIENPAWNLWNTNVVGVGTANIDGVRWRLPGMEVEVAPGVVKEMSGGLVLGSAAKAPNPPGVGIELLGDSRGGGLVALWREHIANHRNQAAMLDREIPLAYQESEYLSQLWFEDGSHVRRRDFQDATPGLNADIWSGTALEFAKTDSLGRQVFLYGDFAPLDPAGSTRTVTTNEKILFTREMIDGVLARDGFMRVGGIDDVRFVVMSMAFTDRLTGQIETKKFLVALDRAWRLPADAKDNGLLLITDDLIVAPQYRVFENGALVANRAPIVLGDPPDGSAIGKAAWETGLYTTDAGDDLWLDGRNDKVRGGEGDDLVRSLGGNDSLAGGGGSDRLIAGGGNDRLSGGPGDDRLEGDGGDDVLLGGSGSDRLLGGAGRDRLVGDDGDDTLAAGASADGLLGMAGDDSLDGGGGADALLGNGGHDTLAGGDGNDRLDGGAGDDRMFGGVGHDRLLGGSGSDLLNGGAEWDLLFGGDADDTVFGGAGRDLLRGDDGHDRLAAGAGNDRLFGNLGSDVLLGQGGLDELQGGPGDDALAGGDDRDWLFGGDGEDRLFGGPGSDRLRGGRGADRLDGGAGPDLLAGHAGDDVLRGGGSDDALDGGAGEDLLEGGAGRDLMRGGDDRDTLVAGAGHDRLFGGRGDDVMLGQGGLDQMQGGGGDDVLKGGDDRDWLFGGDGDDRLIGGPGSDRLRGATGADRLDGGAAPDLLAGHAGDDILRGGSHDDVLDGGAGEDLLGGDAGRDVLHGGTGNDTLLGADGADRLFGGADDDVLRGGAEPDSLWGGAGNDVLAGDGNRDALFGGAGDDLAFGGSEADRLFGGDGNDALSGGDAPDILAGGRGADTLSGGEWGDVLDGGPGDDLLRGDGGPDRLFGGIGRDAMFGGAGADRLVGGAGLDRLEGGAGPDRFVFDEHSGTDVITDFEDGVDAIDFLIASFGFEDLGIVQRGDDAVLSHPGGSIRLLDTDASRLDETDFHFYSSG